MCNFGSHYHFHLCNKKTHYFDDYILLEEICNLTFDYFAGLFVGNEGVYGPIVHKVESIIYLTRIISC